MKVHLVIPFIAAAFIAAPIPQAHANSGGCCVVRALDEIGITPGMSSADVLAMLGRPASRTRYGTGNGPSWSYDVLGGIPGINAFYIDFGPDDRVVSKGEYSLPVGG